MALIEVSTDLGKPGQFHVVRYRALLQGVWAPQGRRVLSIGSLFARGVLGEGPDCHFPAETGGFGPTPARIRGCNIFVCLCWP